MKKYGFITSIFFVALFSHCNQNKETEQKSLQLKELWITKSNQSILLSKQPITGSSDESTKQVIEVDSTKIFQTVDGFGYSLTGGSAYWIHLLAQEKRTALLQELFGTNENSIQISYLRISIGASDLDADVFSYDDMPAGQTDESLEHFSINPDKQHLIPVLKEIIAIRPDIKILGSPWSPPVWMKSNANSKGGSLLQKYYSVYAQYFVKYIQAMKAEGILMDAITIQNEPEHGGNNPSMLMTSDEQGNFIKNYLGLAFKNASISTKIILWDHNCDHPNYPISILNDADAKKYVDGSAFHLYLGDISALSTVHAAHPDKNLYFTEQWTGANGTFDGDLTWHIKNVIIGSLRNWSKVALEWNLASDSNWQPHTPGGCSECKGALTISGQTIQRNVSYYIIAHASKFIPAGSQVISSKQISIPNVVCKTPQGNKVMILLNEYDQDLPIQIKFGNKSQTFLVASSSVATVIW